MHSLGGFIIYEVRARRAFGKPVFRGVESMDPYRLAGSKYQLMPIEGPERH